jgi:hypothetical protein
VTVSWLKYQDPARMLRRVTLTKLYRRAVMGYVDPWLTIEPCKLNTPIKNYLTINIDQFIQNEICT